MNDKIILPNEFLSVAEEELNQGRSVRILADGASMFPFIHGAKDYAELAPLPSGEELKLWEVYLFKYKGRFVIHRYIGKVGDIYRFLGDGNLQIEEIGNRGDVIGRLQKIHKPGGRVVDCTSEKWLRKGKTWNRLLPIRRYLLGALRRFYRYGIIR